MITVKCTKYLLSNACLLNIDYQMQVALKTFIRMQDVRFTELRTLGRQLCRVIGWSYGKQYRRDMSWSCVRQYRWDIGAKF